MQNFEETQQVTIYWADENQTVGIAIAMVTGQSGKMAAELFPKNCITLLGA
jgi:hypothetical protein